LDLLLIGVLNRIEDVDKRFFVFSQFADILSHGKALQ
jgi:hypothetical protein